MDLNAARRWGRLCLWFLLFLALLGLLNLGLAIRDNDAGRGLSAVIGLAVVSAFAWWSWRLARLPDMPERKPSNRPASILEAGSGTYVRIVRARGYVGMLRRMEIDINGELVTQLERTADRSLEIAPGTHRIQARMDWCTSETREFTLSPGDSISFEVKLPLSSFVRMATAPDTTVRIRHL